MVIRGTPFIAAVIMSAAAMLLMPNMISTARTLDHRPPRAGTAMDANLDEDAAVPDRRCRRSRRRRPAPPARCGPPRSTSPSPASGRGPCSTGAPAPSAAPTTRPPGPTPPRWSRPGSRRTTCAASADGVRRQPARASLSQMIRDSDNAIANTFYGYNGGTASINRMIRTCGLTESRPVSSGSWSTTEVSARDGARLGGLHRRRRAAGPEVDHLAAHRDAPGPRGRPVRDHRRVPARGGGRRSRSRTAGSTARTASGTSPAWPSPTDWALAVLTQYPVDPGHGARRQPSASRWPPTDGTTASTLVRRRSGRRRAAAGASPALRRPGGRTRGGRRPGARPARSRGPGSTWPASGASNGSHRAAAVGGLVQLGEAQVPGAEERLVHVLGHAGMGGGEVAADRPGGEHHRQAGPLPPGLAEVGDR